MQMTEMNKIIIDTLHHSLMRQFIFCTVEGIPKLKFNPVYSYYELYISIIIRDLAMKLSQTSREANF